MKHKLKNITYDLVKMKKALTFQILEQSKDFENDNKFCKNNDTKMASILEKKDVNIFEKRYFLQRDILIRYYLDNKKRDEIYDKIVKAIKEWNKYIEKLKEDKEKFIVRGITKSNKFVYGYPFYDSRNKTWHLLIQNKACTPIKEFEFNLTEITKEPDRWTTKYDKNDNKIWENDDVKIGQYYDDDYTTSEHIIIVEFDDEGFPWEIKESGENSMVNTNNIEVIGNIHGIIEEKNE